MAKKSYKPGSESKTASSKGRRRQSKRAGDAPAGLLPAIATPQSYETLLGEMSTLRANLSSIVQNGKDTAGPLKELELELARAAIREIDAASQMFICIQGYSPYRRP